VSCRSVAHHGSSLPRSSGAAICCTGQPSRARRSYEHALAIGKHLVAKTHPTQNANWISIRIAWSSSLSASKSTQSGSSLPTFANTLHPDRRLRSRAAELGERLRERDVGVALSRNVADGVRHLGGARDSPIRADDAASLDAARCCRVVRQVYLIQQLDPRLVEPSMLSNTPVITHEITPARTRIRLPLATFHSN
jgi:hypothetical protein